MGEERETISGQERDTFARRQRQQQQSPRIIRRRTMKRKEGKKPPKDQQEILMTTLSLSLSLSRSSIPLIKSISAALSAEAFLPSGCFRRKRHKRSRGEEAASQEASDRRSAGVTDTVHTVTVSESQPETKKERQGRREDQGSGHRMHRQSRRGSRG